MDTSVLCDLLAVPGKCQGSAQVKQELRQLVADGVQLVLPIATIIETGNHIAHVGDGHGRRQSAERFVKLLRATTDGVLPWVLHAVEWDESMLKLLCDGTPSTGTFVDLAGAGVLGAGDLTILAEREMFAQRTSGIAVGVWTHDQQLAAYAG